MIGFEVTRVLAVAELLAGTLSSLSAETVAVLSNEPAAVGVTTTVMCASAPLASCGIEQLTLAVPEQLPPESAVAETRFIPAGSGSSTSIPAAWFGPLLWTVML